MGIAVGGILGATLADRAYVELAGTSSLATRRFVARFTSFFKGTDARAMARALSREYPTDADDVALAYVDLARGDEAVKQTIGASRALRDCLIGLMSQGWTTPQEQGAIGFLRGL